jgi:hypothetical protein
VCMALYYLMNCVHGRVQWCKLSFFFHGVVLDVFGTAVPPRRSTEHRPEMVCMQPEEVLQDLGNSVRASD